MSNGMLNLIVLIVPLVAGVSLGYALRKKRQANLSKVTFGIIIILIFSLGFSIGSNNEVLSSLPRVGLSAFVITLLAILFSIIFVELIRRKVKLG